MEEREEKECERDVEIDFINQKRGVLFELTAEENLLYGYSQGVTLKLLESIRDKCEEDI